jgi:hypothetical protein
MAGLLIISAFTRVFDALWAPARLRVSLSYGAVMRHADFKFL